MDVELRPALHDILNCLVSVNCFYNSNDNPERQMVSRDLVYAISGIHSMLVNSALTFGRPQAISESASKMLLTALWSVSFAWDAILAGDITDIREHLRLEGNARGIQLD
jgi:hypothetical protein